MTNDHKNTRSKKRRRLWVFGGILLLIGLWQLVASLYPEEEKQLRRQLRETVKEKFPEQTAKLYQTFGLFYFEADGRTPGGVDAECKSVVLIHGLDDPGQVRQNLAPAHPAGCTHHHRSVEKTGNAMSMVQDSEVQGSAQPLT